MNGRIIVGRRRKKEKKEPAAELVFVVGAVAVCVMLALPMLRVSGEPYAADENAAVMAMSVNVVEREELSAPSNTEAEEEWSFFDYIGELFAGLISGR